MSEEREMFIDMLIGITAIFLAGIFILIALFSKYPTTMILCYGLATISVIFAISFFISRDKKYKIKTTKN